MAATLQTVLVVFFLYGVSFSSAQSGSGDDDEPCADVICVGGTCIVEDGNAKCTCGNGTAIYDNKYMCEECAIGYWGNNCQMSCADNCGGEGHFTSCDAESGLCDCNDCWMGDTCEDETSGDDGFACILKYLESVDKDLDPFGGYVPVAEEAKLRDLARELVEDTGTIVQGESAAMSVVNREEVNARPLLQFSFILREGPGNTDYDNAVSTIKDKVKTGEIRGTLIIDESDVDSGTVTLNA